MSYSISELPEVAKLTRPLENRFIKGDDDIAPEFVEYALPLVGKLPKTARLSDFAVSAY